MSDTPSIADVIDRLDVLLERTAPGSTWGRWLDLPEAGRYCTLSVRTLRRLISSGTLTPHRLVPGKELLDRTELDAAIGGSAWSKPRACRGAR